MRDHRKSRGEKEFYSSLEDLRTAWGLKPISKQTKDVEKLEKQRKDFCSRHICRACKQPMTFIGGNIMSCTNTSCKGEKIERTNEVTGETFVSYKPVFELLDKKGSEIAGNIFA